MWQNYHFRDKLLETSKYHLAHRQLEIQHIHLPFVQTKFTCNFFFHTEQNTSKHKTNTETINAQKIISKKGLFSVK